MQVAELFDKAAGKLPMVPKVVQELVASFQRTDVSIDDISNKVLHDQVLSARVLRLANTARFGGNRKVGSLDDAVVMLGFDNLRVLVIASGITGASASIPGFEMQRFWRRSFEIANTSKLLAKLARVDTQLGYTCGLMANIGELVLHVAEPEKAAQIDKAVAGGADRMATEQMMLSVDLAEIGAELARRWNFPDEIQAAIREQHRLHDPAQVSIYARLLGLASFIVAGFNNGSSESEMLGNMPEALIASMDIDPEKLAANISALRESSTVTDDLL